MTNDINTDFTKMSLVEGNFIREKFPGAHVETELDRGQSYINSNGTLSYVSFPIAGVKFKIDGTPQNEQEIETQKSTLDIIEKQEEINEIIRGKTLYLLISETKENHDVLTIPTFRGSNEIYDESTRLFVVGNYTPPSIGPCLGENILGLYHLVGEELPGLEKVIYFHNQVADKQKLVSSPDKLRTGVDTIISKTNQAYELVCEHIRKE